MGPGQATTLNSPSGASTSAARWAHSLFSLASGPSPRIRRIVSQGSEAFEGDLYFYSVDHDLRDKFAEIDGDRCLAVMLTGDYDYLTTPDDSARTAAQINNAEFIEMRGIGHFPMSENHDLFRTFLLQALEVIEKKSHATT